jgi:hypothetical protein
MSPPTDYERLCDIRERQQEMKRLVALPRIDPETGKVNPFVVYSRAHEDVDFLLTYIRTLQDEICALEEQMDAEENDFYEEERDHAADAD